MQKQQSKTTGAKDADKMFVKLLSGVNTAKHCYLLITNYSFSLIYMLGHFYKLQNTSLFGKQLKTKFARIGFRK